MINPRKRVAKRLASGLLAGALVFGGLAISGGTASAVTPSTTGTRIAGSDRYSTAAALATKFVAARTSAVWKGNIVVASGDNFPDALAAAPLAKLNDAPILLVPSNGTMPSAVRDWLLINRAEIQGETAPKLVVVGGTSSVPESTVTTMLSVLNEGLTNHAPAASRRSATDRYATAAAVNATTGVIDAADSAIIVSGASFADAVSASVLAFAAEWPVVLIPGNTLGAAGLATLSAFRTASTNDELYIVGGPAAVSTSVEEELVNAGFAYSKITRIAGADRYLTSTAVNSFMTTAASGVNTAFTGANVYLATGENFADAVAAAPYLAAKTGANEGLHLQLTATSSLSAGAAGLIGALAAAGAPATLGAIGGSSAVADTTLAAAVAAAQSTNVASQLTCQEGSDTVLLTIGGKAFNAAEKAATGINTTDLVVNGASNGAAAGAATYVAGPDGTADAIALVAVNGSGAGNILAKGDVISFGGNLEGASTTKRAIAASTCTVADDATAPVITITAASPQASGSEVGALYLTSSEPVAYDASTTANAGVLEGDDITSTNANVVAAGNVLTALDDPASIGFASKFKVVLQDIGPLAEALVAGDVITVAAGQKDLAGNASLAATATVAATADAVAPTATGAMACVTAGQVTGAAGGVTVTAVTAAKGGSKDGAAGFGYKVSVVNKRGQVLPSIAIDDAAKAIVISADTAYSSVDDVVKFASNRAVSTDWAFSGAGSLTATASATALTVAKTQTCKVTLTFSENIQSTVTVSLTVAGVPVTASVSASRSTSPHNVVTVSFDSVKGAIPAGAVVATYAVTDIAGNAGASSTSI